MDRLRLGLLSIMCNLVVIRADSNYDEEEARRFASLSSVTYCDNEQVVLDWTCTACTDSKTPLAPGRIKIVDAGYGNATRVLIGKLRDQHGCLIAFRGSDNVINWLRDFQVWEVNPKTFEGCDGCKVHAGFYDIWNAIRQKVVTSLEEIGCSTSGTDPDNVLYVTGHSLGAALTHIAMFTLENAGFNIAKSYSFEAPRVGNKAFSDAFSDRFTRKFPVYRLTHAQDPVVHLPPEAFSYVHVQTEVFYDSKGKYKVCEGVEDNSCADQYWDIPGMLLLHSGDHCGSPLVPNGDICDPKGCLKSVPIIL